MYNRSGFCNLLVKQSLVKPLLNFMTDFKLGSWPREKQITTQGIWRVRVRSTYSPYTACMVNTCNAYVHIYTCNGGAGTEQVEKLQFFKGQGSSGCAVFNEINYY
jgi:hypothetical protein